MTSAATVGLVNRGTAARCGRPPGLIAAERFSVGMIVWVLPVVITVGWILSWWGRRRTRWGLLAAAAVISLLCMAFGFDMYGRPISPEDLRCSPAFECIDRYPVQWMMTGLISLGCSMALLILTLVAEFIIWFSRRASV
jgi:hypothetical protein